MIKKFILLLLGIFLLGWLSSTVYSDFNSYKTNNKEDSENTLVFDKIQGLFSQDTENKDKNSPHDWIKPTQIAVYNDQVVIKIKDPEWALFTNTKSMDPVIDSTANALEIIPNSEKDIHVGDIVAYESKYKEGIITHRVVDIGHDSFGWYARLKGDNNDYTDPGKVRFNQIKRVVVGIIY